MDELAKVPGWSYIIDVIAAPKTMDKLAKVPGWSYIVDVIAAPKTMNKLAISFVFWNTCYYFF